MNEKYKKLGFFSAFCVLIIATVFNFESAAINPALAAITAAFPGEPGWKITFISTIPFITSIIFSVLCGKLVSVFNKKWLVVIALALYGVVGMMPGFVNSINAILVLRLITGIGVGICMPIPAMIIAEHYEGEDLKKMNGRMNAVFNFANGAISIVVGAMAAINYRNAFYAFLFMLIVMVLAIIGVPSSPPNKAAAAEAAKKNSGPIPGIAVVYFICMLLIWIVFACLLLTMANTIVARGVVPPAVIGIFAALPGSFNAVAALCYPKLEKIRCYAGMALIIAAVGLLILAFSHNGATFAIGCVVFGFGHGLLVPHILTSTGMRVAENARDKSIALVQTGIHGGSLIGGFFVSALIAHSPIADGSQFAYSLVAVICLIAGIIFAIKGLVTKKKTPETTA